MKELFKLKVKVSQNDEWSTREFDFAGYFVKREGNIVEGYTDEKQSIINGKRRYIKGIFLEDQNSLVFLKMSNETLISTATYVFQNVKEEGFWDVYHLIGGFFPAKSYIGRVKIELTKLHVEDSIIKFVKGVFKKESDKAKTVNRELMDEVYSLFDYIDEKSYYYIKE